jgi:hypothetical protein
MLRSWLTRIPETENGSRVRYRYCRLSFRPLGIAALEDKIVQQAVVAILNEIYEVDFKGFSYGFRPGRNPHQALDALSVGLHRMQVH